MLSLKLSFRLHQSNVILISTDSRYEERLMYVKFPEAHIGGGGVYFPTHASSSSLYRGSNCDRALSRLSLKSSWGIFGARKAFHSNQLKRKTRYAD
ncbi:hypothetical protein TNCV_4000711 [Trichonephila clavipes]|nr:hypothetical protein TNCV_4000711 [Trichonephila clavipes]